MQTPRTTKTSFERPWNCERWLMAMMAGALLGLPSYNLSLAAATETSVEPPRVVSNFVSTENIRSHFFNNMFRALLLPDGRIVALSPVGREADAKMQARYSTDDGKTWSVPEELFRWPKEASKFYTAEALLDHDGEIHIVMVCDKAMWYTRSTNGRTRWEIPKTILTVPPGNPLSFIQLRSGRLLLPFEFLTARSWEERGGGFADFTYLGTFSASSVYSDDGGKTWQRSPDEITVETPDLNTWGASEPVVIQLKDGRVWMLIRTQRGRFYQSFSEDGTHWSPARPTTLFSSDSPAGLLRLKDGSILLFSNACQGYPYAYGARNVLHVAISKDEGRTWRGFREVARDPLRAEPPLAEGDYGLAYSFPTQTADGQVLFTNWVQSGRDRSFRLLDPAWIYETRQATDFSRGIDDWSSFATRGVGLEPDPARPEAQVLSVRKAEKDWPAGAVWNFPVGSKGQLKLQLMLRPGFGGTLIGLTDHFSIPWDMDDQFHNVFNFPIPADGQIFPNFKLTTGNWHEITLDWDLAQRRCSVSVDGKRAGVLQDERLASGINYLRVRSLSSQPDGGLLLRAVSADVSAGWPDSNGSTASSVVRKSAQSSKAALGNRSERAGGEQ